MKIVDLSREGPILVRYHDQAVHVVPILPYGTTQGVAHRSNIRIFPEGGGIRAKLTMRPKQPFLLRMTDSDGSPTNYDTRIPTTCIELEPAVD